MFQTPAGSARNVSTFKNGGFAPALALILFCALIATYRPLAAGGLIHSRAPKATILDTDPCPLPATELPLTQAWLASAPKLVSTSPQEIQNLSLEFTPDALSETSRPVVDQWLTTPPEDAHRATADERISSPTIRAQSPDISLLPLASGETPLESTVSLTPFNWSNGRLRADYVTDFDETDKVGVQILTEGGLAFGIDAEVGYWQRPVPGLGRESLWVGDVNAIYNICPIPRFKLRSGVGPNWMIDGGESKFGYNFTVGTDILMLWRAMFTGELDWGRVDKQDLFRYRLGLGLTVKSFDLFTGYESQSIGDEHLNGWMNGIAIWY